MGFCRKKTLAVVGSMVFVSNNFVYGADNKTKLDTVTVTGDKEKSSEFDSPGASSTVNKQDLETIQPQKLSEALRDVPGASFTGGPRALAEKPTIRGLGDSRILITVDGVRQNFTSGHKGRVFVEPELLKSVKVVRGAATTEPLGGSSFGGAIVMTTKDAGDFLAEGQQIGLRLKAGFQNVNNEYMGTTTLFGLGNLSGVNFDYLASITAKQNGDTRLATNDNGTEYLDDSSGNSNSGLYKLSFLPNDNHKLTFSYQRSYTFSEIPIFPTGDASAENEVVDRETIVEIPRVAYRYDNPENPLVNFYAMFYQNRQKINELRVDTGGRFDQIEFKTPGFQVRNSSLFDTGGNVNHVLLYGVDYHKDEMTASQGSAINTSYPNSESEYKSVYFQDQITLFKDWVLIPGVRYDEFNSDVDNQSELSDNPLFDDLENSYQLSSYSLGLIYKILPKTNISLNYAQAFNPPTLQQLYISGDHGIGNVFLPNPFLKPERLTAGYEFAVKSEGSSLFMLGDTGDIKFNVYHNAYDDFINLDVRGKYHQYENLESVVTYGFELESNYYHPSIDGDFYTAFTYIEGDNTVKNEPLGSLPGNKVVLRGQKYLLEGDMVLGLRGEFNLERTNVPSDSEGTPSYNLYDFYLTWYPPLFDWMDDGQIVFGVDNLFDTRYTTYSSILPSQGRNIKLSVSTQF